MVFNWIQSPCKECQDRDVLCHSKCEKYKEYRAKHEAESKKHFMEQALNRKIGQLNYESANKNEKLPEPLRHGRKK